MTCAQQCERSDEVPFEEGSIILPPQVPEDQLFSRLRAYVAENVHTEGLILFRDYLARLGRPTAPVSFLDVYDPSNYGY
jgi:hypothetical protein